MIQWKNGRFLASLLAVAALRAAGTRVDAQAAPAGPLKAHPVPLPTLQAPETSPRLVNPLAPPDPTTPVARDVFDAKTQVRFHLPAGWNLSRKDGEVSTFHLDARTAPRTAQLRVVAQLAFNPYPLSTLSSVFLYLSTTPHSTVAACAAQASSGPDKALPPVNIGGVSFMRGHEEQRNICTDARDIVYTALRKGSCVRFDLAENNFCGGEVSGAVDVTAYQLANVFRRMVSILDTVQFTQ